MAALPVRQQLHVVPQQASQDEQFRRHEKERVDGTVVTMPTDGAGRLVFTEHTRLNIENLRRTLSPLKLQTVSSVS